MEWNFAGINADYERSTPGGAFSWLTGQVDKRYPEFEGGYTVVGFDIDVW